jgi:hypothetical protein
MSAEQMVREPPKEEVPPPTGTIFLMTLYMLVLIAGWGVMFWLLVDKS